MSGNDRCEIRYEIRYEIVTALGQVCIKCLRCGKLSFNQRDIAERYCGHCHVFHDQPTPP